MKKAIIAVSLVLVFVALLPFINGLLMERTVRRAFHEINSIYTETGTGYSLSIIKYDRGFLSSDIEWKIDVGNLKPIYRVDEVVFNDHAKHGFAGVVSTTSLEKNPWFASFVAEKLQGRNPLHISSKYSLLSNIESKIAWDAFSVFVEGETVDVKPASLFIETDCRFQEFSYSGNWQGLSVGDKFTIGQTSLASDLEMISTFLWDGEISFDVQNIKAQEKGDPLELENLKGEYFINVNDDQTSLSGEALFSIDGLNSKNLMVDNVSVRFSIKEVNVEGYEEFIRMYTQTLSKVMSNMESLEKDPEKSEEIMNPQIAAIGLQMMAAYEKLLKAGLEFQISDLQVKLSEGDIKGDITLRLLKDMTFIQFAPIAAQPDLLLDILYIKSDLSLPVNLVGENSQLLTPVHPGMQTGLFVKKGDFLVHKAETIDGKLMINNKAVVLTR